MQTPPVTLGLLLALVVLLLAVLLAVGVLPLSSTLIGVCLALLAVARVT